MINEDSTYLIQDLIQLRGITTYSLTIPSLVTYGMNTSEMLPQYAKIILIVVTISIFKHNILRSVMEQMKINTDHNTPVNI